MSADAATALRAQAAALRTQADSLEALANALGGGDELLDVDAVSERYGIGRQALRGAAARGELVIARGARNKWLVRCSAVEAWLASRPYRPNAKASNDAADLAAWDRGMQRRAS